MPKRGFRKRERQHLSPEQLEMYKKRKREEKKAVNEVASMALKWKMAQKRLKKQDPSYVIPPVPEEIKEALRIKRSIKEAGSKKANWLFEYRNNYIDPSKADSLPSLFEVAKMRRNQRKEFEKHAQPGAFKPPELYGYGKNRTLKIFEHETKVETVQDNNSWRRYLLKNSKFNKPDKNKVIIPQKHDQEIQQQNVVSKRNSKIDQQEVSKQNFEISNTSGNNNINGGQSNQSFNQNFHQTYEENRWNNSNNNDSMTNYAQTFIKSLITSTVTQCDQNLNSHSSNEKISNPSEQPTYVKCTQQGQNLGQKEIYKQSFYALNQDQECNQKSSRNSDQTDSSYLGQSRNERNDFSKRFVGADCNSRKNNYERSSNCQNSQNMNQPDNNRWHDNYNYRSNRGQFNNSIQNNRSNHGQFGQQYSNSFQGYNSTNNQQNFNRSHDNRWNNSNNWEQSTKFHQKYQGDGNRKY